MIKEMTCIICPVGCTLKVELSENGEVTSVTGNTCPRGKQYAADECTNPVRTVTTTARSTDGRLVPVKTAAPIPKDKMFELISALSDVIISLPINSGDVIMSNIFGTDVVAAKSME